MARPQNTVALSVDPRRVAVRSCIRICLSNGWPPPAEAVWRMVTLKEAWLRGERGENNFDEVISARLQFARWLYEKGKIES